MFYGIKATGIRGDISRVEVGVAEVTDFEALRAFARARRTELEPVHPDVLWWSVVQYGDPEFAVAWREERLG
jgi:hypothetical protein